MKRICGLVYSLSLIAGLLIAPAAAQNPTNKSSADESCPPPVYKKKEVSRPAKIISSSEPRNDEHLQGRIVVTAVLCRTGKVTDIKLLFGLTAEMNKRAIESVRQTKFTPAEKDGQPVSQYLRVEYFFDVP